MTPRPKSYRGLLWLAALLAQLVFPQSAHASEAGGGHADPIVPFLFTIVLVIVAAKLGGDLAVRLKQPEVLGELVAGVVLGNLGLFGYHGLDYLKTDESLALLAGLGVILLLFEVGLESTIGDMLKVGASSFLVAVLGVVAPFLLGWGVASYMMPEHSIYAHVFIGATLCATSVGITARVLQDLGRSRDKEARIILGAAVIDDVLGLVILAVISGVIAAAASGGGIDIGSLAWTTAMAVGFLFGALAVGNLVAPRMFRVASYLRAHGMLQATALMFCFLLAGLSGKIGLAPIVGAFAAGLLLEDVHFKSFDGDRSHANGNGNGSGGKQLEESTKPLIMWLAPFFFVQMGTKVELATFARTEVLSLAGLLTLVAIVGKQVCSLGVLEKGLNRFAVGLGMIPRGEVGLIFAQIGESLRIGEERIIDESTFSAIVIMVIVTTVVTPGLLKWSLSRSGSGSRSTDANAA